MPNPKIILKLIPNLKPNLKSAAFSTLLLFSEQNCNNPLLMPNPVTKEKILRVLFA